MTEAGVVDSEFEAAAMRLLEPAGVRIQFAGPEPVKARDERDVLAYGLAYTFACSVIESQCVGVDLGGVSPHWDLREEGVMPEGLDGFRECVKHLEACGLLARDPDFPHLAQILDESEAHG